MSHPSSVLKDKTNNKMAQVTITPKKDGLIFIKANHPLKAMLNSPLEGNDLDYWKKKFRVVFDEKLALEKILNQNTTQINNLLEVLVINQLKTSDNF